MSAADIPMRSMSSRPRVTRTSRRLDWRLMMAVISRPARMRCERRLKRHAALRRLGVRRGREGEERERGESRKRNGAMSRHGRVREGVERCAAAVAPLARSPPAEFRGSSWGLHLDTRGGAPNRLTPPSRSFAVSRDASLLRIAYWRAEPEDMVPLA